MYPYIHIGKYLLESYTLFINLGTLIGILVMYIILGKCNILEKNKWKLIIILLTIMGMSSPFARFIKGLFYNGNGTATHFIGRVLVALVVFELILAFSKDNNFRLEQVGNSIVMYLAIQHFFNRLSCLMNGCCGGKIIKGWNKPFPSQIFEMSGMLILMGLIVFHLHKRKSFYYLFYICFSIIIFISEFYIDDTRVNADKLYPITGVQLGAIILCILSLVFYILKMKLFKESNQMIIAGNGQ